MACKKNEDGAIGAEQILRYVKRFDHPISAKQVADTLGIDIIDVLRLAEPPLTMIVDKKSGIDSRHGPLIAVAKAKGSGNNDSGDAEQRDGDGNGKSGDDVSYDVLASKTVTAAVARMIAMYVAKQNLDSAVEAIFKVSDALQNKSMLNKAAVVQAIAKEIFEEFDRSL